MNSVAATSNVLGLPGLLAIIAYGIAGLPGRGASDRLRLALLAGWLMHAAAIVVDVGGLGDASSGARFGFAPAVSVTLWLVLAVYGVESRFVPLPSARRVLACLCALAVALALVYPGELRPLASSSWAPLHWMLGIASYGLFGVAVLHGVLLNRAESQMRGGRVAPAAPGTGLPLLRLERLTFWFVGAGFTCCRRRSCWVHGLPVRGGGITRPRCPCWAGRCLPACWAGVSCSDGVAAGPPAGSTRVPRCCCWRTWVHASSSRCCCTACRAPDPRTP